MQFFLLRSVDKMSLSAEKASRNTCRESQLLRVQPLALLSLHG
jgi:hypothetical protein